MTARRSNRNNGFSLVELAIGLAVVTVLILAISMSSGIRDSARIQSAADSVQALRTATESYLAAGKTNYAGVDVTVLKTEKLLPSGFNNVKSNPWGGDFNVAANAASNTRFDISLTALQKVDADKLTLYFNNTANSMIYDSGASKWTATF